MTEKIQVKIYVKDGVREKLREIADSEMRSVNNLLELTIDKLIKEYEQKKETTK